MNARHFAHSVAGTTLFAAFALASALPASAASTPKAAPASAPAASPSATATARPTPTANAADLATVKARCNDAVQQRLGALGADLQFIKQSVALTSGDRGVLASQVTADQAGLTALDATIQADSDIKKARADCQQIVDAYRVYLVEEPKIHEVIAADAISGVDGVVTALVPTLQGLIDGSSVDGAKKAIAQAALNDLKSKVAASATAIAGVSASVINLTPAGFPGNAAALVSAHHNIVAARDDLLGARADVAIVLHQLGN